MSIGMQELVRLIQSGSPEWRDRFAEFHSSGDVSTKFRALTAAIAGTELLREGNPDDYPWATELFDDFLQHGDLEQREMRIACTAAQVQLFAMMHRADEARHWLQILDEITSTGTHEEIQAVRQQQRYLRNKFRWLW